MNRIYKIIWSKAKNAYVVTSEIAKSHTKGTSGKVVKASLAAAVGLGLLMGGYTANAAGHATTVEGTGSEVKTSTQFQGATASIYGAMNQIDATAADKPYDGVANSIVGAVNVTKNANAALIFGAGNLVKNSYGELRDKDGNPVDPSALQAELLAAYGSEGHAGVAKVLGNYVSKSGGSILAVGGGNAADWAKSSAIIGTGNTLTGAKSNVSSGNFIAGQGNTVTTKSSETNTDLKTIDNKVIGSENTITSSSGQTVIGDKNSVTDRNVGTVSGKHDVRPENVSDLVIGKGNKIEGNDTYMKGYESLTVIGNNNEMVNPGAGIVIGDNQKVGASKESVVIGSMTPEEKADSDIVQKHASVVVGYHAQSGTRYGGGMNVALGHGAKAYGWQETVTGIKSIVEAGDSGFDGYLASVYGGLNTVASSNTEDQYDGMANTVVGTLNKTEGANGALVFGAGNSVTHSFGTAPTDENGNSMNEHWGEAILFGGQGYAGGDGMFSHDEIRKAMGLAMSTGGGSVVTMGNGNTSDYAVHSQIIGSGNILTGTANTPGINNTINGYANTGRNVERVSMMGTGNNMSGSTADVVIGDYHHMDGGKNNVILGSMATEKKAVEKTYTMKDASGNVILEQKYKVMENVPIKSHTANISNAVMLGYNTDVEKDGGVALGADSIASVDKGVAGYDPSTKAASTDTSATWQATAAAVSVGKAADPTGAAGSPAITRQITNVAAGAQDTDAVNVAQLKAVANQATTEAAKHTTVEAGDYVTVTESPNNSGGKKYTVNGPAITSTDGTVKIEDKVENGKKVGYNLSVNTSKLNIKDMHVKEGTVTYDADGKGTMELTHQDGTKATVTGIKDTKLQTSDNALKLDGKKLSMSVKDTAGNEVKGSVDLSAIAGEVDTNTTYEMTGTQNADNTTTITMTGSDGKSQRVTVATKDTRNTVKAGENVSLTEAFNTLGGTEYTINVKADGKVEKGNTKIISGDTVYKETRVEKDGNYVKKDNTAGQNLSALDKQVGTNTQNITNNTKMINELGGQVSNLDNRISKVGAGAAALAALHPLDFDPHDKWDIAAGFGNYRNASAAAVGLFYRPNERTMFSLSATMGDDRNMFNAGVSVKLGSGSTYSGLSKAEMADRLEKQDEKMEKMESELKELKAQIAQLAAKK